jgi:hypothetical protein
MLDGVRVVRAGLLEKLLEVVCRRTRRMLIIVRNSQAASHAGATRFPIVVIITAGRGRSPFKTLLAPLVVAFDTLLGAVGSGVRRHLLVTARVASLLPSVGRSVTAS